MKNSIVDKFYNNFVTEEETKTYSNQEEWFLSLSEYARNSICNNMYDLTYNKTMDIKEFIVALDNYKFNRDWIVDGKPKLGSMFIEYYRKWFKRKNKQ